MSNNLTKAARYLLAAALLAVGIASSACGSDNETVETETDIQTVTDETEKPDTEPPETETETTESETTAETEPPLPEEPENLNPLTGLEADIDLSDRRPVAIMINNIQVATPQEGVSYADIMYECVVEGWQTRLMMVVSEYESLPIVGSVRSSREYYLDFAANHDAIYIHAGGSQQAYAEIKQRKVDNLDGVNMYIPNMFYRDSWRQQNMGYEHSLMTNGDKIVDGIEYKKYRTEIDEDLNSPLDFVPYGEVRVPDNDGTYLKVKYSGIHQPYFKYDEDDGVYYRWQFNDVPHMDNTADEQLSFANVIVLYLPSKNTGDSYNHMDVTTTGTGEGYYFSQGGYEVITWEKDDPDLPLKLYNEDGDELLVNRGKTFFQICTTSMKDTTEIK